MDLDGDRLLDHGARDSFLNRIMMIFHDGFIMRLFAIAARLMRTAIMRTFFAAVAITPAAAAPAVTPATPATFLLIALARLIAFIGWLFAGPGIGGRLGNVVRIVVMRMIGATLFMSVAMAIVAAFMSTTSAAPSAPPAPSARAFSIAILGGSRHSLGLLLLVASCRLDSALILIGQEGRIDLDRLRLRPPLDEGALAGPLDLDL